MSANPAPESAAPAPKSKKKLLVAAVAGVLLLASSGAGAWWYLGQRHAGEAANAPKPPPKTSFVNLEPFTVNLNDPRGDRFAQVGITLEFEDPKLEMEIKERLPAIRNNILLLVSSKEIEELLSPEGKQALAREVREHVGVALGATPAPAAPAASAPAPVAGASAPAPAAPAAHAAPAVASASAGTGRPNPIRNVLFSHFIVQ